MTRRRGNAMIETAMFVPLFILLLVGTVEIARVTFIYYSVHKIVYNAARLISTRMGANLCDEGDSEVTAAKNFATTGLSEGGEPIVTGLTADMLRVRVERQETGSDILGQCECSLTGCDAGAGGRPPDFVVVSVPDGFTIRVTIPYLLTESIVFRPSVRVPAGGA